MFYAAALIVHLIAIIIWIGGVSFVTMISFPMLKRLNNSLEQVLMFQGIEHRFANIAKVMIILAGLSGAALIHVKGLSFGVWVMIFLWSFYTLLIFGLEKIIFDKVFAKPSGEEFDIKKVFFALQTFHWVILALSFFAVAAGVVAAHY